MVIEWIERKVDQGLRVGLRKRHAAGFITFALCIGPRKSDKRTYTKRYTFKMLQFYVAGKICNAPPAPDHGAAKNFEFAAAPSLAQLPLRGVEMLTLLDFMHAEIFTCLKRRPPAPPPDDSERGRSAFSAAIAGATRLE
jgi:hypothetical protein